MNNNNAPPGHLNSGIVLDNVWKVNNRIDTGRFSSVYEVRNINDSTIRAVKSNIRNAAFQNRAEVKCLEAILAAGVPQGLPRLYHNFIHMNRRFLILERYHDSLEVRLMKQLPQQLPLKFVLEFGRQAITILERLHELNFVHRDIKPANFVLGTFLNTYQNQVYLIDFGDSTKYVIRNNQFLTAGAARKNVPSNLMFGSHMGNRGFGVTRRDDIISVVYCMIYCLTGTLPWAPIPENVTAKQIGEVKRNFNLDILFDGIPVQLRTLYERTSALGWKKDPNYTEIRNLIIEAMEKNGITNDGEFE